MSKQLTDAEKAAQLKRNQLKKLAAKKRMERENAKRGKRGILELGRSTTSAQDAQNK